MKVFETLEFNVRSYCRSFPKVFAKASGEYLYDEEGKAYIDFFSGAGALNFAHNHPEMKQALLDYIMADGVVHGLDMATTARRRFMEIFQSVIFEPREMAYKIQFAGPTGTNAVEAALKLARRV
jgi:diaminobutyrate-2-oxoglutarate transaminase